MMPVIARYHRFVAIIALVALVASACAAGAAAQGNSNNKGKGKGNAADAGAYNVTVECSYAAEDDRTTCTITVHAGQGAKKVNHFDVPEEVVCAEVIDGEYKYVDPDPTTGVTGYQAKGNNDSVTLVLAGNVSVGGSATYAAKAASNVYQVAGPGLVCGAAPTATQADQARAAAPVNVRLVTFHCPAAGERSTVFAPQVTGADAGSGPPALDGVENPDACIRAAAVGFAVRGADGAVVVQAATDGLGEAVVALPPGTYTLEEQVLGASTEITVAEEQSLTVAVAILGVVDFGKDAGTRSDVDANGASTPAAEQGAAPGAVSDSTGAIVVRKYACDFAEATPEIDWKAACALDAAAPATFRLTAVETSTDVPASAGATVEGVLGFDRLPPGRYHLEEVDGQWCHAQSDNVDSEGQVIVQAGERTTVWVFACGTPA